MARGKRGLACAFALVLAMGLVPAPALAVAAEETAEPMVWTQASDGAEVEEPVAPADEAAGDEQAAGETAQDDATEPQAPEQGAVQSAEGAGEEAATSDEPAGDPAASEAGPTEAEPLAAADDEGVDVGESAEIADGVYSITSFDDPNQTLDIMGESTASGANLALFENFYSQHQKFKLTRQDDGTYSIIAVHSDLAIGVEGDGTTNGSNVAQRPWTGSDAQRWVIEEASEGAYRFASALSGLYLDVEGGHAGNSVNIQIWQATSNNGGRGQLFYLESIPDRTVADGVYAIESRDDDTQVLDICASSQSNGANLALYHAVNTSNQKFEVTYLGDGSYSIVAQHSGQALDVVASGISNGTNVTQWPWTGADNQRWYIEDEGDGWYRIVSKCSGLSLDVQGGHAGDGVNVQTWEETSNNGGAGQLFRFSHMVDNGVYFVKSHADAGQVLDVVASSRDDGANVTLWNMTGAANQKFRITHLFGHYYKVENANSGKALDVSGGGQANGTNVTQWSSYDTPNQVWRIEVDGSGVATFQSQVNGLYLDVQGQRPGAGVNVWTWEATDSATQRWELEKTSYGMEDLISILDTVNGSGVTVFNSDHGISAGAMDSLNAAVANYHNSGYSVGFVSIDLNTGQGVLYNPDGYFYSASTIKGPYVISLNKYWPWELQWWSGTMWSTIDVSSNESYAVLRNAFGTEPLRMLIDETHAWGFDYTPHYVNYTARQLCKLWVGMSDYLMSDEQNAWWCRDVFDSNGSITSRGVLSWKGCTIYAKSGWVTGQSHNEGYLVMDGDNPYVTVIMSNALWFDPWQMRTLISAIDTAHSELVS